MKKILGIIIVGVLALGLCACSNPIKKDTGFVINSGEGKTAVDEFKAGTNKTYSGVSCGDAFEYYFADTNWSQFKGEKVATAIEFSGKCIYQDFEADVLMQFALSDDGSTFSPEYLSFNQIPQTKDTLEEFLTDIFATYSDYRDGAKKQGTSDVYSPIIENSSDSSEPSTEEADASVDEGGSESVPEKDSINYQEAYGSLLTLATPGDSNTSRYYLYDMDRDGIQEMILSGADTTGIYSNKVYKPVENKGDGTWGYQFIGDVPNEVEIHGTTNGQGFITIYLDSLSQIVERVYIDETGKIQTEVIYKGDNANGKYESAGPLRWSKATDDSLLTEANDADFSGLKDGKGSSIDNSENTGSSQGSESSESSEYVIADSDTVLLQESDLNKYTKDELRLARNEIVARHGYIFKSDELNEYFKSKSWYKPTTDADDFDMNVLNDVETQNMKKIKAAEAQ